MENIVPQENEDAKLEYFGNGMWLNYETGEIVEKSSEFHVRDTDSANWVMEHIQESDAQLLKLHALYVARTEQLVKDMKATIRKREFFENRYKAELEEFASKMIALENFGAKKPARSMSTDFGTLGYRRSPKSLEIPAETHDAAVEWSRENCPDALKEVITLLKTPLQDISNLPEDLFIRHEAHDEFYIKTGVSVPAEVNQIARRK